MTPSPRSDGNSTADAAIRQQELVADLGRRAFETDDPNEFIDSAATAVGDVLEAEFVTVLESVPGDDRFLIRGGDGIDDDRIGTKTTASGRNTAHGTALAADAPIVVDDLETSDRFDRPAFLPDGTIGSAVCASTGSTEGPWGVLAIYATATDAFDDSDAAFVQSVANVLGSVVDRERANRRRDVEASLKDKVVETSPISITIVDGEMRFANDRAEEIFGRSKERIDKLRFDDHEWDEIGPDGHSLSSAELPFSRILELGEPLFDQVSGVLRPDGQRVWISISGAPLSDGDGDEIDGVVFAIDDISDRFEHNRFGEPTDM